MSNQKVTTAAGNCVACSITLHMAMPIPMPVHYELPVDAWYAPGKSAHSFTSSVKHGGLLIAKAGHDCGPNIIHVPVSLSNLLLVIIIPSSSRQMVFSASTVKMNGDPTGCSNPSAPTPMMTCAEPCAFPISFPINNGANTVLVGMTWADFLAGYFEIVVTVVANVILFVASGGKTTVFETIAGLLGIPVSKDDLIKMGVGAATGAVRILVTGEGSIEVGLGNRLGGGTFSVNRKRAKDGYGPWDEGWELDGKGQLYDTEYGPNTKKSSDWDWDGTSSETETSTTTHPDGSRTEETTETHYDEQGRETSRKTTTTKYDPKGDPTSSDSDLVTPAPSPLSDALHSDDELL